MMPRFVEGSDRSQVTLLPECLDDYLGEDNPVRVVEAFIEELDLEALGFAGMAPAATGRPSYHPSVLLKTSSRCRYHLRVLTRARPEAAVQQFPSLRALLQRREEDRYRVRLSFDPSRREEVAQLLLARSGRSFADMPWSNRRRRKRESLRLRGGEQLPRLLACVPARKREQ
jgi:hypothetical protein